MTESIGSGWGLLRSNLVDTVVYSIMLGVINILLGLLVGVVVLLIGLLVGVPLFLLLAAIEFPMLLTVLSAAVVVLALVVAGAGLSGPLLAYYETAWTLAWQHLSGEPAEGALAPNAAL